MPYKDLFSLRIRVIYSAIFLLAAILIGRLAFVQTVQGGMFRERAGRQYISSVPDSFDRGAIFFQDKNGKSYFAATIKTGFIVAINPTMLIDAEETFSKLSELLPELDEKNFFLQAGKKDDPYEEIARRIPDEIAQGIESLNLPGVFLYKEKWRFYPSGSLGSHVLGFVGWNGDDLSGRYGIERYYDDVLRRNAREVYVNFFAETFANLEQSFFYGSQREGDIFLTIEPEIERILQSVLHRVVTEWNADSGGAIIINPKTGAIYALTAEPTFDPNNFSAENDLSVFSNPIVESVFEMGSIVKPLTVATGLDTNVIKPGSVYNDAGTIFLDGSRISNYDGKARGIVSMQEVLNQSLNTGAVFIMQRIGKETFAKYFFDLGLGEETGIDLPGEVPGLVGNLKSAREIEYATASFGQGIATTPIAMVRALSALANGGVLVTPHLVKRIDYGLGSSKVKFVENTKRVFKEETSEEITRMLVRVVDEALLGGAIKLDRFSIAAKTGTAQIAISGGGYYEDKFLHSFFGYFPAYDPQFLVFFYIVNPKGVRYSSQTLADPFMEITKFLLNYYTIPPDR